MIFIAIIVLILAMLIFVIYEFESSTTKKVATNNQQDSSDNAFALPSENHIEIGLSYIRSGEYDKAEKIFRSSIDNNSDNILDYILLVRTYTRESKYEEALSTAKEVIKAKPTSDFSLFVLGSIYNGMGNYTAAENEFKNSLLKYPNLGLLHSGLGWTYLYQGE
jgi:tetratricopeptide (TPR) repeat protein